MVAAGEQFGDQMLVNLPGSPIHVILPQSPPRGFLHLSNSSFTMGNSDGEDV
jgi:hypothetical protein